MIEITPHAIDRFMERSGCRSTVQSIKTITKMLEKGKNTVIKDPVRRTLALLNHDLKEARYLKYEEWILVIEGKRLVTIHKGEGKFWK